MRRGSSLAALALAAALFTRGGLRLDEAPLFGALVLLGVGGLRGRGAQAREPAPWLEAAVVVAATGLLLAHVATIRMPDWPLGTDVERYLGNAVAVAEGHWKQYQRWRAPGYAWASLALTPLAGGLLEASRWVSGIAAAACVPLTWAIGRATVGRWAAILGAALVGGWTDLAAFGRFSTPYALATALVLAGVAAAVRIREGRLGWAGVAGLAFGLAGITDVRALVVGAAVAVAVVVAAWVDGGGRRAIAGAGLMLALSAGVEQGLVATLPIELLPLSQQVSLQEDLHSREGPARCPAGEGPLLGRVLSPCGLSTLRGNLARADAAAPLGLVFLAIFAALGLRPGERRSGPLLLVAPALPALPSLLLIGAQHRYALPFVPLALLLGASGLARLGEGVRGGRALAGVVVIGWAIAWARWPGSLLARVRGDPGTTPAWDTAAGGGYVELRARLRPQLRDGDRVVDCASGSMAARLYPFPVEEVPPAKGRVAEGCRRILAKPSPGTWVVVQVPAGETPPGWTRAHAFAGGDGREVVLLHAT